MNGKKYIASILGVLSLILITSGVTLAVFSYVKAGQTENSITTDGITFIYNEESKIGRGIQIVDAIPMTDNQGKTQTNQKFDFRIVSKPGNTKIKYTVTARKISSGDTLDSLIDLYLTDQASSNPEVFLDKTAFGSLSPYKESTVERVLFEKVIDKNDTTNGEYNQDFRLRIWLDSSADFSDSTLNNKEFKIIVNVNAVNYTESSGNNGGGNGGNTPSTLTLASSITTLASTDTTNLSSIDPDGNIRYVGEKPNNYVWYNEELWRIVGVFNGRVKIVRNVALGTYSWDTSDESINNGYGVNEWTQADIMTELNTDYLNTNLAEDPYWYNNGNNQKTATFDRTKVLTITAQNLIDDATWYYGVFNNPENRGFSIAVPSGMDTREYVYNQEKTNKAIPACREYSIQTGWNTSACNDEVERTLSWTGKVALLSMSDFFYSTGSDNYSWISFLPSTDEAATYPRNNYDKWMLDVLDINDVGNYGTWQTAYPGFDVVSGPHYVHPTVYLKSSVLFKSGTGTELDPFIIGLE